jgi:hypothetical protein
VKYDIEVGRNKWAFGISADNAEEAKALVRQRGLPILYCWRVNEGSRVVRVKGEHLSFKAFFQGYVQQALIEERIDSQGRAWPHIKKDTVHFPTWTPDIVQLASMYGPDDISDETFEWMRSDCKRFMRENIADLEQWPGIREFGATAEVEGAANFWFMRTLAGGNNHWEEGWYARTGIGPRLVAAARRFREPALYVGRDLMIHHRYV